MIRIENLHYVYNADQANSAVALRGINLDIAEGEYVVIIGRNGSGKSTLAKHLNALLLPTQGDVWIRDMNTKDSEHLRAIRQTVGMVFQVPDNQLVATVVEEDVAFGPENMGLPHEELRRRVDEALHAVDMSPHRSRPPHMLSAGQKQRVAIAGVMAMRPNYLVLDEATAMLDPQGRRDLLETIQRLHRQGITIIAITHFMSEATKATRVVVMDDGLVAMDDTPERVFAQVEEVRRLGLDIPPVAELARRLHQRQPSLPGTLLTVERMVERLCHYRQPVHVET